MELNQPFNPTRGEKEKNRRVIFTCVVIRTRLITLLNCPADHSLNYYKIINMLWCCAAYYIVSSKREWYIPNGWQTEQSKSVWSNRRYSKNLTKRMETADRVSNSFSFVLIWFGCCAIHHRQLSVCRQCFCKYVNEVAAKNARCRSGGRRETKRCKTKHICTFIHVTHWCDLRYIKSIASRCIL